MDVSNLWQACRELHGPDARVNFRSLLDRTQRGGYQRVPRRVKAIAYAVTSPRRKLTSDGKVKEDKPRNGTFLDSLSRMGFQVKTRWMRWEKGIAKPFHTDWDVGIAVDALKSIHKFDTFVLASGDGDYAPLIKHVQDKGKRVEVYTFEQSASQVLFETADSVFFLDDGDIYIQEDSSEVNSRGGHPPNASKDR